MDMELFDSFDGMLEQVHGPAVARELAATQNVDAVWEALAESGYADVLVSQEQDGAGLGWSDAWQILFAAGRHGLELPFAQTMVARALLAEVGSGWEAADLYSVCGLGVQRLADGTLQAPVTAGALVADGFLFQVDDALYRVGRHTCTLEDVTQGGGFDACVTAKDAEQIAQCAPGELARMNALALAAQMAGAADKALSMTLTFAAERKQFGRSIGKFQALQQQISEMAEWVYAMRMASQLGCDASSVSPVPERVAMAKAQTSQWASLVAHTAHSVHGAIGITREHDLQLVTRALHAWARIEGGQRYWSTQLGDAFISSDRGVTDFMREEIFGTVKLGLPVA